jgi:SAM-dependent methyltransferase
MSSDAGIILRPHEELSYYSTDRGGGRTIYDYWEEGAACGDSITPSTYCESYRGWIGAVIEAAAGFDPSKQILSLGCGNGFVEADLVARGYDVAAIDLSPQAVALARSKGVPASVADVARWSPGSPADVVYADGLFGHLYDAQSATIPLLSRVQSWVALGGYLIVANDAPPDALVHEAGGVPGFFWLSAAFLRQQLEAAGLRSIQVTSYSYQRPISGRRERAVLLARRLIEH